MKAAKPKYNPSIIHFHMLHHWHGFEEIEAAKPAPNQLLYINTNMNKY